MEIFLPLKEGIYWYSLISNQLVLVFRKFEISTHWTAKMKKRGNTKCWPKCWPKILTQLKEVWSDTTSLQNYLAILNKDEHMCFHSYYTPISNMYICLPKDMDKDVHSSTVYNTPALETAQYLSTVVVQLLSPTPCDPWTAVGLASLSFTISQNWLKLMSTEWMISSNHPFLCHPLLFLPSVFPESRSFPMSQLFASSGQSIGASASASVLPINIQGWFPLGLTDLISLQSKGLSRVLSNTTVQKRQFFGAQPSLWSNSLICTWLLEKP